jgi:hypothetical protein
MLEPGVAFGIVGLSQSYTDHSRIVHQSNCIRRYDRVTVAALVGEQSDLRRNLFKSL